jgi:hypothetical protein
VVSILPKSGRSLLPWFCMTCAFSAVFRGAKFGFTVIVVVIDGRAKRPFPLVKHSQDSPPPTSPSEKHTFSSISHQASTVTPYYRLIYQFLRRSLRLLLGVRREKFPSELRHQNPAQVNLVNKQILAFAKINCLTSTNIPVVCRDSVLLDWYI